MSMKYYKKEEKVKKGRECAKEKNLREKYSKKIHESIRLQQVRFVAKSLIAWMEMPSILKRIVTVTI